MGLVLLVQSEITSTTFFVQVLGPAELMHLLTKLIVHECNQPDFGTYIQSVYVWIHTGMLGRNKTTGQVLCHLLI